MNEQRYIIILPADGQVRIQALENENEPTREQIESYIGGNSVVRFTATHGVLVCNSEYFFDRENYNAKATELLSNKRGKIYGDAVLCRENGRKLTGFLLGNATRIAESLIEFIQEE